MKNILFFICLLAFPLAIIAQKKEISITFDDLPFAYPRLSLDDMESANIMLLQKLKDNRIPAAGFVNGKAIYKSGEMDRRTEMLRAWIDSGCIVGSHTYSHPSLNDVTLEEYEEDFIRNENILDLLYGGKSARPKYFRYPFLHMGSDTLRKNGFMRFLESRAYTIAPVTIDNEDYIFNKVYTDAYIRDDKEIMRKTADAYLVYLEHIIDYYDRLSQKVSGRIFPQVLLCHANLLNAHYLNEIAGILKKKSYTAVSLDQALNDPMYRKKDTLLLKEGWSHLDRWKKEDRIESLPGYPGIEKWIMDAYEND